MNFKKLMVVEMISSFYHEIIFSADFVFQICHLPGATRFQLFMFLFLKEEKNTVHKSYKIENCCILFFK